MNIFICIYIYIYTIILKVRMIVQLVPNNLNAVNCLVIARGRSACVQKVVLIGSLHIRLSGA